MKFKFKEGTRVRGVDAQTVGETLESIRQRYGKVETQAVMDESRPEDAPLHPAIFDRPVHEAAEEYYKENTRRVVRSIEVVNEESGKREPAYVHVAPLEGTGPGHYQTPDVVAQNVDEYARAMAHALSKLRSAERAVEDLRNAAAKSDDKDRLTNLTVILKTLSTAGEALSKMN